MFETVQKIFILPAFILDDSNYPVNAIIIYI